MTTITLPVYQTKLPVSGRSVEFSPLIVKEEKIISAAKDTGSKEDSYLTFLKILENKIDVNLSSLCETDLVHCMIELRKRSIGETVKFAFTCPHTKESVTIETDCNDIKLSGSKMSSTIHIDGYNVKIHVPKKIGNIASAIESIQTPAEIISFKELSDDQKNDIVDSLSIKIKNCIEEECAELFNYNHTMNYFTANIERKLTLRSAEDFFTLFFVM